MEKKTTKTNRCPDCGGAHEGPSAEYQAEYQAISDEVEAIGKDVALHMTGKPAQSVALALMIVAVDALRRDFDEITTTPVEKALHIGKSIGLAHMFFQSAVDSAMNEAIPTSCAPTKEKYPELYAQTLQRLNDAVTIVRDETKATGTDDLHGMRDEDFRR